jgi:WD40 repeat protein
MPIRTPAIEKQLPVMPQFKLLEETLKFKKPSDANSSAEDSVIQASLQETLATRDRIRGCAFSQDGKYLACAYLSGTVEIRDSLTDFRILQSYKGRSAAQCAAFSPDGNLLASGHSDGVIQIRNPHTGVLIKWIQEFAEEACALEFSLDGNLFAALYISRHVMIFTTNPLKEEWTLDDMKRDKPRSFSIYDAKSIHFSPDGKTLAALTDRTNLHIWDLGFESPKHKPFLPGFSFGDFIFWGHDVILKSGHSDISVWRLEEHRAARVLPVSRDSGGSFNSLSCFSRSDETVALACTGDKVCIWSFTENKVLGIIHCSKGASIERVFTSPNGNRLVALDQFGRASIWNLAYTEGANVARTDV